MTSQTFVDRRVHHRPPLCEALGEELLTSADPEAITCQTCSYYHFQPNARRLELAERRIQERAK